ncbi:hypothetical protein CsSME_00025412 [Camellia sinensis var. sinensis]
MFFYLSALQPLLLWYFLIASTEAVIEIDFTYYAAGKISGAFCMQLLRPSQDKSDTIVVPLEAELGGESANDLIDAVSVSLETLLPCDSSDTVVVALLLRNGSRHLLNVVKISLIGESTKLFQIKYKEGLILFPGTDTHVAVVSSIPLPIGLDDYPSESLDINWNCKLVILTNDSSNPQIEMPCKDIVSICSKLDSYLEYEQQPGNAENANARTGSLRSGVQSPSLIKGLIHEVFILIMRGLSGAKVTRPGKFRSCQDGYAVKSSLKTEDGVLYPLEKGFFFLPKPPTLILHEENAWNEAFHSGRHTEAVEHYAAMVSSNIKSRPFAAICFCNRAAAHQSLGQIADVIADCSLAIVLDGSYSKVGQFLARNGDDGQLWKEIADEVHENVDRLFKMIGEAYAVPSDPTKVELATLVPFANGCKQVFLVNI